MQRNDHIIINRYKEYKSFTTDDFIKMVPFDRFDVHSNYVGLINYRGLSKDVLKRFALESGCT